MSHIVYYDVSKYQGDYVPVGPVCVRSSYGDTVDPKFAGIRARAKAKGFACLPYHYLTTATSPANQAQVVTSIVGKAQNIMVDVELHSGNLTNVVNFIDQWERINGGKVVLTYLPHWYWQGYMGSPSLSPLKARNSGLVSSNYTSYSDSGPGWNPYGGLTPVVWQYSTAGNLDHNAFKGSVADLEALWGAKTTPPVPPPVPTPNSPVFKHDLVYHTPQVYDDQAKIWQQQAKDKWGSAITPDGYYGKFSLGVCLSIQKLGHLVEDGVVGPKTWAYTFSR